MASPPVCRIMDYGKFRYEESQKAKESRKKTIQVSIKEVKFRPKIGKGDFDTKVRHMQDFLADGHKVKVTLQFRGREMAHPELGARILDAVIEQVGSHGKVETMARLEGRNMTMVLAPEKKVVVKKPHEPKASSHGDQGAPEQAAADAPAPAEAQDAPEEAAADVAEVQQAPAEPVEEVVVETADPA
jgi:translation initiation factor IF-3